MKLGSFDLYEQLGHGGTAEVWRGMHRASGVPVAIKVYAGEGEHDEARKQIFQHEVAAMAALTHPHVVWVLDHGRVDAPAMRESGGELPLGAHYVAMELAEGGTLQDAVRDAPSWPELRAILLAVLDALAYAHARGVIHRDLKPSNVLLGGLRPGPKLADFGLAHVVGRSHRAGFEGRPGGTLPYMAPEQFLVAWRDYGPWTDLYALGSMVWRMVTGQRLFEARGWEAWQKAHLTEPLAALEPRMAVPAGMERWLRSCLAKDPSHRFQRAADAAWALLKLEGDPEMHAELREAERTLYQRTTLMVDAEPSTTTRVRFEEPTTSAPAPRLMSPRLRPAPVRWERAAVAPPPTPLLGTGLPLFGLREVPMVGRRVERDSLWATLRTVSKHGGVRAVVLRGAAGCGKSRLARWVGERAHELGAAELLDLGHGPVPGPMDGIGPMLERHFQCSDLDRETARRRIASLIESEDGLPDGEVDALTEWIHPTTAEERASGVRGVAFRRPLEQHVVVERALARLRRPAVLWLDDAQWGLESLQLAQMLLERQRCRALIVITVREEALPERRAEAELLRKLSERAIVESIDVQSLADGDVRELLRRLLPLAPSLAVRLEERAAGNPLYAVQALGHLVSTGMLEARGDGFALRDEHAVRFPTDLSGVWDARLDRLLEGRPIADADALELAAALGKEVHTREWLGACARAGLRPDAEDLWAALVFARLAVYDPTDGSFAFVHGMLRDALERRARAAGRWDGWNAACADELAAHPVRGRAERIGRHRLAAGQHQAALQPLLQAFDEHYQRDEFRHCARLLEDWGDAIAEQASDDPRRLRGDIRAVHLSMVLLDLDDATARTEALWPRLEHPGVGPELQGEALRARAGVTKARGHLAEAAEDFGRARQLFREAGTLAKEGRACWQQGECLLMLGDNDGCSRLLEDGLACAEEASDDYTAALLSETQAGLALRLQDLDLARAAADRTLELAQRTGSRLLSAKALRSRAGIAEQGGELEVAAGLLEQAASVARDADEVLLASVVIYLGLVRRAQGRYDSAVEAFRTGLDIVGGRWGVLELVGTLGLAAAVGALGGDDAVVHWQLGRKRLEQTGYHDPVVPMLATHIGLALAGSHPEAARLALELAVDRFDEAAPLRSEAQAALADLPPAP